MFILAAILFLTTMCNGQVVVDNPCPDVQVVNNFHLENYLGQWFDAEHYNGQTDENRICIYSNYSQAANGFSVVRYSVDKSSRAANSYTAEGSYQGSSSVASFNIETSQKGIPHTYHVLGTDYENFSVIFICNNIPNSRSEQYAWIVTRSRNPSSEVLAKGHAVFDQQRLSRELLVPTVQQGCNN